MNPNDFKTQPIVDLFEIVYLFLGLSWRA